MEVFLWECVPLLRASPQSKLIEQSLALFCSVAWDYNHNWVDSPAELDMILSSPHLSL